MLQLDFKEVKIPWIIIALVLLYIASALIFTLAYRPAKKESYKLDLTIQQLERSNQNLARIVEQEPSLRLKYVELEEYLVELIRTIPSQYDLPWVLAAIEGLSYEYDIYLEDLSHVPLAGHQGLYHSTIPIKLRSLGNELLVSFYEQLFQTLPALRLDHFMLSYSGNGELRAEAELELRVLILDQEHASMWQTPLLTKEMELVLPSSSFGVPFATLQKYLPDQIKVLGIVNSGSLKTALLSQDNARTWVNVGDSLGEALVSHVSSQGVWLDLDGVQIELRIGG